MSNRKKSNEFELVVIIKDDKDEIVKALEGIVTGNNAAIVKTEKWGKKNFSYPINKQASGCYIAYKLTVPRASVNNLRKALDFEDAVMRYLLLNE